MDPGVTVAGLAEVVRTAAPGLGAVRLVCIDGPAGSGKTTLAGDLARALERSADVVAVLHLDDMYEGWSGLGQVWERVESQVLTPLAAGRPARYQRYDWGAGGFDGWIDVPVPDVLVVEGCGSAPRAVDGRASLILYVEAPQSLRLARGLERDGQEMRGHWERWMAQETDHYAREDTRARSDVVVDGSAGWVS